MIERKKIAKTPREHFMQAAADELARFVRKEIAFQKSRPRPCDDASPSHFSRKSGNGA